MPISSLSPDQLQPRFLESYFTYTYYPTVDAFALSMGINSELPFQQLRSERGAKLNPILIALNALVSYNEFIRERSDTALIRFHSACNFLEQYGVRDNQAIWFYYYFDYPKYKMISPWVSGLTQALILSVFLRKKEIDPALIEAVFNSLWVPLEHGGVLTNHPFGHPWIAEYPSKTPPYVFNGQLSIIISLLEYLALYPKPELRNTLTQMVNGIFQNYSAYVLANRIKYCWTKSKLASIHYEGLHAFQLMHLFRLTHVDTFKILAEDWIPKVKWRDFARFHYLQKESFLTDSLKYGLKGDDFAL